MRATVSVLLITAQAFAWLAAAWWNTTLWMTVATVLLLVWLWFRSSTSRHNAGGGDMYL